MKSPKWIGTELDDPLPFVRSPSPVHLMVLWGMIAGAGAAGMMAVGGSSGWNIWLMLPASLGLGWLAWILCRRRRDLVLPGLIAVYGGGLIAVCLQRFLRVDFMEVCGLAFFFLTPAIGGCGLSWFAGQPDDRNNRDPVLDAWVLFFTILPLAIILIGLFFVLLLWFIFSGMSINS